jgi:hypothetical protein
MYTRPKDNDLIKPSRKFIEYNGRLWANCPEADTSHPVKDGE